MKINLMKPLIFIFIFIFTGCSFLPPTTQEFENSLESIIGSNMNDKNMWYYNAPDKLIKKENTKEWHHYYKELNCKFKIITDLNNTIIYYEIITPKTCKLGYSSSW